MSWDLIIAQALQNSKRPCIMGVGSQLKSDDAAGMILCDILNQEQAIKEQALIIGGSTAPENFCGEILAYQSDLLLIVDAAQMDKEPGTIQIIDSDDLDGLSFSTHMLPLSLMLSYLISQGQQNIILLGIQPASTEFGFELNPPVDQAIRQIAKLILTNIIY